MTSVFQCKYGCGTWLHVDDSIRSSSGKHIPLQENESPHNCHLSPYYRNNSAGRQRAVAYQKNAIVKLHDYDLVEDLRTQIANANNRLWNYELELVVRKKDSTKV